LSYTKLDAARKFTNKLWNIARFIQMKREILDPSTSLRENNITIEQPARQSIAQAIAGGLNNTAQNETDKEWVKKTNDLIEEITRYIDGYQFNLAAERLYEFIWHEYADIYIEDIKKRINEESYFILHTSYFILLKLLHPFMPFVTEAIYQKFVGEEKSIMIEKWPARIATQSVAGGSSNAKVTLNKTTS